MKETGKERFILTKAYEVAYALFRLAANMSEKSFAESIKISGTALLTAAATEDYIAAERSLREMECLIKFGGDVGIIGSPNVDVMMREVYALDAAVAERKASIKTDEVNVAEIFSKPEIAEHTAEPAREESIVEPVREPAVRQSVNDSAIRQSAILERIRQSGNCRMKDIQDMLPNISERTIRYDLQPLIEQGLIERIGNAGPSVFYRAVHAERSEGAETYVPEIR